MKVIGITGPSGAGKTTVLKMLQDHGAAVFDCDRIYYELLRQSKDLRGSLLEEFGPVFLPDGELDREKLGKVVFEDSGQMQKLNALVFYHMGCEIRRRLADAKTNGTTLAVIDAINLLESGMGELCDTTLAVLAPEEDRICRIMKRDGLSRSQALRRIHAQKPEEYYRRHAELVVENRGTVETLLRDAEQLLSAYLK